jgi:hypothetical protein
MSKDRELGSMARPAKGSIPGNILLGTLAAPHLRSVERAERSCWGGWAGRQVALHALGKINEEETGSGTRALGSTCRDSKRPAAHPHTARHHTAQSLA